MEKATKTIRLVTAMILAVCAGLDLAKKIKEHIGGAVEDTLDKAGAGNLFANLDLGAFVRRSAGQSEGEPQRGR